MERKLVTVKVGTSSLTHADGSISPEKIEYIVAEIAALRDAGHTVILVTSGGLWAHRLCKAAHEHPRKAGGCGRGAGASA